LQTVLGEKSNSFQEQIEHIAEIFTEREKNAENEYTYFRSEIEAIHSQNKKLQKLCERLNSEICNESDSILGKVNEAQDIYKDILRANNEIKGISDNILGNARDTRGLARDTRGIAREILWSEIFNNTIQQSSWLKNQSFSPGRWAAGYPFLYFLYRILRDAKPKRILELGLGETTRMISQYARADKNIEHYVVEHDPQWIDFFRNSFELPPNTEIVQLPWGYATYNGTPGIRIYDGFAGRFSLSGTYDFICIDGPLGEDMKEFSRIDTLDLIPGCLGKTFVVSIDDYNRRAEKNTVLEMLKKLDEAGIEYEKREYIGQKSALVVCSKDMRFLCSL